MSPHPGQWWHRLEDGRIQCDLCPRDCRLHDGQRGTCPHCGTPIAGRFAAFKRGFGRRRIPVRVAA